MKANADMLGVMSFNGELIRNAQMRVGHLSRLGRSMIQSSGSAIRVAALLELVDRPAAQARPVTPYASTMYSTRGGISVGRGISASASLARCVFRFPLSLFLLTFHLHSRRPGHRVSAISQPVSPAALAMPVAQPARTSSLAHLGAL